MIQRNAPSVKWRLENADQHLALKTPGFDCLIRNPHLPFDRLHLDDAAIRRMKPRPRTVHVDPRIWKRIDPNGAVLLCESPILTGDLHRGTVSKRGHHVPIKIGRWTCEFLGGRHRRHRNAIKIDRSLQC